ncbi:FG-GAP repeat domain-containing protein, partial [Nonomuraea zeae]
MISKRVLTVLTVLALCSATPAYAADDPEPLSGDVTIAYATAPCDPKGTTSRDATLATQLNRVLTGKMDGYMSAYRVSCARKVVQAVQDRGMAQRAAVIAVTTTIVETSIQNISETVDHDSLGLFQQRASWGSVNERLDPIWATNAFLNKMVRIYPGDSWKGEPIGEVCQAVQVSAYPDRYQPEAGDAQKIVEALWTTPVLHGADFNSDGIGDIFSEATGTLHVWNGRGSNNFTSRIEIGPNWEQYSRPISGDFNSDGISDLLAVKDGTLHVWNGKGANNFAGAIALGPGWTPYAATLMNVGDINGDGKTDIGAIANDTFHVWNGKGANNFSSRIEIGANWGQYSRPISGDFNSDGIGDLAAVKDGTLHVWNGKGSNNFTGAIALGPGWTPYAATLMTLGDINSDGHTDIAAVLNDHLQVWNGKGANNFAGRI